MKIIVSIDGGGIRGIIPLVMLSSIEQRIQNNRPIASVIDFFAGTSTGSVIAGALMARNSNGDFRFSLPDVLMMYKGRGAQIFSVNKDVSSTRSSSPFKMVLDASFGDLNLKTFTHSFLFLSHDNKMNKPYFFSSTDSSQHDTPVSNALMACSAVPGYFVPVLYNEKELVDGMLTAKNPSLYAYEQAKKEFPDEVLVLISLGTGISQDTIFDQIDKYVYEVDGKMKEFAKNDNNLHYFRFDPMLHEANYTIDDTSEKNCNALINDGTTFLSHSKESFDTLIRLINSKLY
jgi:uncharacterized protein